MIAVQSPKMLNIIANKSYWQYRFLDLFLWTAALLLTQYVVAVIMAHHYPPQTIKFINGNVSNFRAGDLINIFGWGNYLNKDSANSLAKLIFAVVFYMAFRMAPSVFYFSPTLLFAGAFCNKIEMFLLDRVLDFIIFPAGGHRILALSLGDVAIFLGTCSLFFRGVLCRKKYLPKLHRQLQEWSLSTKHT